MARTFPRWLIGLDVVAAVLALGAIYMGLLYAPDAVNLISDNEIKAQHIFYHHMGANVATVVALGTALVSSILYLATRRRIYDIVAVSAVETGVVFGILICVTGSFWARPTWNTWWTWDPRLTSAAITLLIYIAYLMLRGAVDDPNRRARFAAVYAIFAFVSVPITYFSIRWWRTIHPVLDSPELGGEMGPSMRMAYRFSMLAFGLFAVALMIHRARLERARVELDDVKERLAV